MLALAASALITCFLQISAKSHNPYILEPTCFFVHNNTIKSCSEMKKLTIGFLSQIKGKGSQYFRDILNDRRQLIESMEDLGVHTQIFDSYLVPNIQGAPQLSGIFQLGDPVNGGY